MGREIDNTVYYQFAADPGWDYSTGRYPNGNEPEWIWEERFNPAPHQYMNETVGPHQYRREKVGRQSKQYGLPMFITATEIETIQLIAQSQDDDYTYYNLIVTWSDGKTYTDPEKVLIPKGKDGTDGKDGEGPANQEPAETWFNTLAELRAFTGYVDGVRYGVFENTTVYIYDQNSTSGEQPDDNPGVGRYEVDYNFNNQYATLADMATEPMVQAAKGVTPALLQYWWDLAPRQVDIKTKYEANADTNAFSDADVSKLGGIEALAEVNQTDAEIKIQYENNADTNAFTDSDVIKLGNALTSVAASEVTNDSTVTGASVKDALEQLDSDIGSITLDTDAVTNVSTVSGVTASDALEGLDSKIDNLSTDNVANDSLLAPGVTTTDSLDGLANRFANYPLWNVIPGTDYTAVPVDVNTITTSVDLTTYLDELDVVRATLDGGGIVYLQAKSITPTSFVTIGDLITADITKLEYERGNNNAITEDELELNNDDFYEWGDVRPFTSATNGAIPTDPGNLWGVDLFKGKPFKSSKGALVHAWASVRDCGSAAGDPEVTVKFDGVSVVTTFTLSALVVDSGSIAQGFTSTGLPIMVDITDPGLSKDMSDVIIHLLMFNDKDPV